MLTPVTHIAPLVAISRLRLLPVPGRVLVRAGQNVRATDVIATANTTPKHYMLNVARGLGVSEDDAEKYIERMLNDEVAEGDVIATRSRFGKRIVRSPVNGTIELITAGQMLIEVKTEPYQLKAGIPGVVAELIHGRGAVIKTTGALIQGVWGNGQVDLGLMNVLAESPDHVLSPGQIDVSMRGSIVLAGHCDQQEALRSAGEQRLRGLILASLSPELVPMAAKMPHPIVVLGGFGQLPMSSAAFKLLSTNDKREVVLNGEPFDRTSGNRPEVLIPLPGEDGLDVPVVMDTLAAGRRVFITRSPYQGKIATVEAILPGLVYFPNALRAPGASLRLEDGSDVQAPLANLEILN